MKELRIKMVVNIEKKYKVGLLIKVKIDNLVISGNPYWIFVDKGPMIGILFLTKR